MRIKSVRAENFGSYKNLEFSFDNKGLVLISGPTGSGKSTLCDVVPWALYGKTAKNGSADEIRTWACDDTTYATIIVKVKSVLYRVHRQRLPNDLYYSIEGETPVRGKDLADTQRLINELLGVNVDQFLAGVYFHEFSQTAGFFTTTAKIRRQITENLVDLTIPTKLSDSISKKYKEIQTLLSNLSRNKIALESRIKLLNEYAEAEKTQFEDWKAEQELKLTKLSNLEAKFSRDTQAELVSVEAKILAFEDTINKNICPQCGQIATIKKENPYLSLYETVKNRSNPFSSQIQDLNNQKPPKFSKITFDGELEQLADINDSLNKLNEEAEDLDVLSNINKDFRGLLISNTIKTLEEETNQLLENHFEAEIKVHFTILESDKLDFTIQKDENEASFTQLSKGQRQILKLCFGIAVMQQISNFAGVSFNCIFADEPADGMDESIKAKAFSLLQEVSSQYSSVFVIEHNESIKSLFANRVDVELKNGHSTLEIS